MICKKSFVLVVSPLNALMRDRTVKLNDFLGEPSAKSSMLKTRLFIFSRQQIHTNIFTSA